MPQERLWSEPGRHTPSRADTQARALARPALKPPGYGTMARERASCAPRRASANISLILIPITFALADIAIGSLWKSMTSPRTYAVVPYTTLDQNLMPVDMTYSPFVPLAELGR